LVIVPFSLFYLRKQSDSDLTLVLEAGKTEVHVISSSQSSPTSMGPPPPPPVSFSPLLANISELRNHIGSGKQHYVTFFYDKDKQALTIKFTEKKNDAEMVEGVLVEKVQFIF
jgi:hypothetical protein